MANLTMIVSKKSANKYIVEMDADKLERLAAAMGWFNPDFLSTMKESAADLKAGRYTVRKSLKELQKK